MRVLLEEVVLDLPHVVDPDAVGQLDLLERVVDELLLVVRAPRPGELVLVEDAEPHGRSPFCVASRDSFAAQLKMPLAIVEVSAAALSSFTCARVGCSSGSSSSGSAAR